jgi:L-aspartate-alpha-decarboxylase
MLRIMCKSKIHRATISKCELHYNGSIGIDKNLLKASNIYQNEIVQVVNINNGARFETYAIEEPANSGTIGLYGAAAHMGKPGDLIIILSYGLVEDSKARGFKLTTIKVDNKNKIKKTK